MNTLTVKIYQFYTELFKSGQQKNNFDIFLKYQF